MQHDVNLPPGSNGWFQYYLARPMLKQYDSHGFLETISQFHAAAASSSLRLRITKTAWGNCIFWSDSSTRYCKYSAAGKWSEDTNFLSLYAIATTTWPLCRWPTWDSKATNAVHRCWVAGWRIAPPRSVRKDSTQREDLPKNRWKTRCINTKNKKTTSSFQGTALRSKN